MTVLYHSVFVVSTNLRLLVAGQRLTVRNISPDSTVSRKINGRPYDLRAESYLTCRRGRRDRMMNH